MSPRRSDRSLAALLLVQRLVDNEAEPLGPKEFWSVVNSVDEPERPLPDLFRARQADHPTDGCR